jgi:hypothetical protein
MFNEATLVGDNHPAFGPYSVFPSNRLCGNPFLLMMRPAASD